MEKLSVITINFNNKKGLERTLKSIALQTTRNFEYIVIDGGSTDGSVETIKEYESYIDYWVSEPDNGIYNAMNKGTQVAHGEFCQYLNSGDWYFSNYVVECVTPFLTHDVDILTGYTYSNNNGIIKKLESLTPPCLVKSHILGTTLAHPSSFIRRELLLKRPYDENLKIVGDWKFFVESAIYENAKYKRIELNVTFFEGGGISSDNNATIEEGACTRNVLIHPNMLKEIEKVPPEVIHAFGLIPQSLRFKKILGEILYYIIHIYGFFNKKSGYKNIQTTIKIPSRVKKRLKKKILNRI